MKHTYTMTLILPGLFLTLTLPTLASVTPKAKALTEKALVVDGHNDLPWTIYSQKKDLDQLDLTSLPSSTFHTDITRLRAGGVKLQFWSAYVPAGMDQSQDALDQTLKQIDFIHRMAAQYPAMEMANSAQHARELIAQGKIASMIGVEGGYSIHNSLAILRMFHKLGVRYMTLTHSKTTDWADSATDAPKHNGLSEFGKDVIQEMNRLGMLIDISHVSPPVMHQVLALSQAPVIASHSSSQAVADHPRNVPDDVLAKLPQNGGVIMVNFYSGFIVPEAALLNKKAKELKTQLTSKGLSEDDIKREMTKWYDDHPTPRGTVHTLLDHIDHIVKVAGIDHVGLGSDYDGVDVLPEGLEDVSTYPVITQGLMDRGYSEADILKILGENAMRALEAAESLAQKLQVANTHNPKPVKAL